MEQKVSAPVVTTKHGRLRSNRKSRHDVLTTVENLATMEVLDEVNYIMTKRLLFSIISDFLKDFNRNLNMNELIIIYLFFSFPKKIFNTTLLTL